MRASTDRILTTHVGSLQTPEYIDPDRFKAMTDAQLRVAVEEVVQGQKDAGVDILNEGELTKGGIWVTYIHERFGGFEPIPAGGAPVLPQAQDWIDFADYYKSRIPGGTRGATGDLACVGPVVYRGQALLQREIDLLVAALGDTPRGDAFLTSTAPLSLLQGRRNDYYRTEEEFIAALADAIRVEYRMIVDAGLLLQVDDAWLAALWDRIGHGMGLEAYRRYCEPRIEALNYALKGIPAGRVRYHLCWGSWPGPHSHDIPMAHIVDLMLRVNAQAYLFEAANGRHEHEYAVWRDVDLPDDKILVPGVISHCTPVVEHPQLIAERIQRFATIVGRERVIAGTDCGLGIRTHPQVAWAKLKSMAQGAAIASEALWGRRSAA
ncbi:MAG: cobalamin-independent methionine synthase II family protein [Caulobacteraceae bacterium]